MRKHVLALFIAMGILLLGFTLVSATMGPNGPGSGIKGTSHDLSSTGPGTKGLWVPATPNQYNEICIFCHAPHHTIKPADAAAAGLTYYPLWNHAVTTANFTGYQNTDPGQPYIPDSIAHQLNSGVNGQVIGQPGGVSKLCLSCHDGTIAIGAYGSVDSNLRGNASDLKATGRILIGAGGDLSNHHPVGIGYQAVIVGGDDEIQPTGTAFIGSTHGMTINDALYGGNVECGSCHDVHNTKNDGDYFLWVSNTSSNLCCTCHKKCSTL